MPITACTSFSIATSTEGMPIPAEDLTSANGSWPRDNATEGVSSGLDRSVAAQQGRFEHIFLISV